MPECVVNKILTVTGVNVISEMATGDLAYQVNFGYYVENKPEIIARIPSAIRENFVGKQIAFNELSLIFKTDKVLYAVGSKWNLKIFKNGNLSLVAAK
ncbi:MAG: hypothetical protein ABSC20_01975 [Candidatus Bathyarchaeia archaeon]|jgi:CRISPR/Cas system CMR-associated protein Cmr5 small subunit